MTQLKITPMMQQYLAIKEQYLDYILFYRMGDFYEMFLEDAVTASRELEITLTARNKKDDAAIPMCGFPVKAADVYIARLIDKGYKVAICEQTEDAALAKGLVRRDVVRVITPGMIVSESLLDEKSNNFVLAVSRHKDGFGLSCLDLSTGTFRVAQSKSADAIVEEARKISPNEILLPESLKEDGFFLSLKESLSSSATTFLSDRVFTLREARNRLLEQFNTRSLEGFGCEKLHAGVCAAGALIFYVQETQKQTVSHLTGLETYALDHSLLIDEVSFNNLELTKNLRTGARYGTLIDVMDATVTALGGRLLKKWLRYPLVKRDDIAARLDAVDEAKKQVAVRKAIRESLKSVADMERLTGRISMGYSTARDLNALKDSIFVLPEIIRQLQNFSSGLFQWDASLVEPLQDAARLIDRAIVDDPPPTVNEGGMIRKGYHPELDELIQISKDGKGWLAELEARERVATGINSLKVRYNRVFGYYIEVSKASAKSAPPHYVRKQTLVNAERYITDDLKTFETKVLGAEEKRCALEYDLFCELRTHVIKNNAPLMNAAQFIANLDCLLSHAEVADLNGYVRPEINIDGVIHIEDGRHPVVEKLLEGNRYVPNTIHMDNRDHQVLIITGPNMAGKSTVLRQVALIVLMAQMGSFVPAVYASLAITDRIFTRVGALDNLSQGQSTFMVEMEETANILNNSSPDSLVVMDEIGRGTSTFDGLSIAWAVAEFLHDLRGAGVKTLFATHYHELTDLATIKSRVKNFNIAVKEWNDEIIFLHKLVEGGTNRSYGIQVARLAGIPEKVIKRAKKVLSSIEQTGHVLGNKAGKSDEKKYGSSGPVQLSLFRPPEEVIIEKLRKIDISSITPLEALNYLHLLKEKAGSGGSAEDSGIFDN
ncbi:MAG: DNA mismatch repair protein MutS [Desulfobacteraceae bacterium]|nr:MAG: DNA mismatch repair protein MutS [Desulfobacteraceae bacterium]